MPKSAAAARARHMSLFQPFLRFYLTALTAAFALAATFFVSTLLEILQEHEKLYRSVLRSHKKTSMLIRAIKARLRKAAARMKKEPRYWRVPDKRW